MTSQIFPYQSRVIFLLGISTLTSCTYAQLASSKIEGPIKSSVNKINIVYEVPNLTTFGSADWILESIKSERDKLNQDLLKIVPTLFNKNGVSTQVTSIKTSGKEELNPLTSKTLFKVDQTAPLMVIVARPLRSCEQWISHSTLTPSLKTTCPINFIVDAKIFDYKTHHYIWSGVIKIPQATGFYDPSYEASATTMTNQILKDLRSKKIIL